MALAVTAKDEMGESQPIESDFRKQIPAEGLREYWYPAVLVKKIGRRRPVGVRLLGENLVFFRDRAGKIVALQDLCAHRGSKLSRGVCHFPGTITCPYHGWTYDAEGKCVAALVEGPESRVPQSGVEVPFAPGLAKNPLPIFPPKVLGKLTQSWVVLLYGRPCLFDKS